MNIKILVAFDNKEIKSRMDKKYKDRVYEHDIDCMENVIEFLSSRDEGYIVITKDTLSGNIDKKLYIKQLRLANKKSKIVYIVNNLTQEYKEFLFANEVFNIIEGKNIDFDILTNYIDNPKDIVYRNVNSISKKDDKKRIIGICGTSGVGKSVVSSIISKDIANVSNKKTILVDMNIENPSIDILNNLDSNNKNLSQYILSSSLNIKNCVINNGKLSYLANKHIRNLELNKSKLIDIYNFISNNYSYSFIDLSSNNFEEYTKFWLDKVTDIFVVLNPNYLSIRRTFKYLSDFKNKNIFMIINSIKYGSLDISQIKSLLPEHKIIGKVYYGRKVESCINGATPILELDYDLSKLYKEFNIENKVSIKNVYLETYKKLKETLEKV